MVGESPARKKAVSMPRSGMIDAKQARFDRTGGGTNAQVFRQQAGVQGNAQTDRHLNAKELA